MMVNNCDIRSYHAAHEWVSWQHVHYWCEGVMPQARQRCRNLELHEPHAWQQSHGTNYRWCVGKRRPAVRVQCTNDVPHAPHRWRKNPPGDVWCGGVSVTGQILMVRVDVDDADWGAMAKEVVKVTQGTADLGRIFENFKNVTGNVDKRTALQLAVEQAQRELARLERFPDTDPFSGEAVIYAKLMRRSGAGMPMTAVFLRLETGLWYATGGREFIQRCNWTALVEFLAGYDIDVWDVLFPRQSEPDVEEKIEGSPEVVVEDMSDVARVERDTQLAKDLLS